MAAATEKAATLIEALSYIQQFRDKAVVVKVGGSFLDDDMAQRSVLTDIVFMRTVGIHPILVHGGGRGRARGGVRPRPSGLGYGAPPRGR